MDTGMPVGRLVPDWFFSYPDSVVAGCWTSAALKKLQSHV